MRKSDKKLEREIIRELTRVCEAAKFDHEGFIWLTHEVDYQRFPQSLKITLVFNEEVSEDVLLAEFRALIPKVQSALQPVIGVRLPASQIEACLEYTLQ
ncbi:hypothetical protein CEW91_00975 [Idiomarina piscisalsi]|uniref:Fis family transcriptional regulator n=1 Tax=Idiomarina piscisalsi TaxID=1096243 RepID=A0ABM6LQJ9_9GAMM|nr:hypothetical protein [Idiomarina piscisalsi]ASG64815.1 hypothetical protein CEW91_00975 [Idiomarina piscisalsi]